MFAPPAALWVGRRWILTLNLGESYGLAKHSTQMLFHAREKKKKFNKNLLHPINSKNFVFVRRTDQAFKPLFFGNPNALTLSARKL